MANDNLPARQIIVNMAQGLGAGQYGSQLCPACSGGSTRERTLSLGVEANGIIKFHCHRASCGFSGTAYATPGSVPAVPTGRPAGNLNPLTADIHPLSDREIAWFKERFHIPESTSTKAIFRTDTRYALPIFSPNGSKRGWITRRPWDGSPADTVSNRNCPQYGMKALTYMEADDPVLSWYSTEGEEPLCNRTIVLVEDSISAMRLAAWTKEADVTARNVAALMGTGVNAGKIAEIQLIAGYSSVIIALDPDATGQAFAMARKWGQAFHGCRVLVLSKDIKDMRDIDIAALPL